eukprot:gene5620-10831_t
MANLDKYLNLAVPAETVFCRNQRHLFVPVVIEMWQSMKSRIVEELSPYHDFILGGNGRNDSPGFSAWYCVYVAIDLLSQLVVDFEVLDERETGGVAGNLECEGMTRIPERQMKQIDISEMVTDASKNDTSDFYRTRTMSENDNGRGISTDACALRMLKEECFILENHQNHQHQHYQQLPHSQHLILIMTSLKMGGEKEWMRRNRALNGNWTGMRENLLASSLMKEIMPLDGSKCAFCDNDAELHCASCRKIPCASCDGEIHKHHIASLRFGKMVSLREFQIGKLFSKRSFALKISLLSRSPKVERFVSSKLVTKKACLPGNNVLSNASKDPTNVLNEDDLCLRNPPSLVLSEANKLWASFSARENVYEIQAESFTPTEISDLGESEKREYVRSIKVQMKELCDKLGACDQDVVVLVVL